MTTEPWVSVEQVAQHLDVAKDMAQDVREVAEKANPGVQVVQLYRDYLLNFMINQNQDRAAGQAIVKGARA